jgi:hypothetical protein
VVDIKKENHSRAFYHILVWPHENILFSTPEIESDLTYEDCLEILKGILEGKTFLMNGRERRSDRVTRYEVYRTDRRLNIIATKDTSFVGKSDYKLITSSGEKVTRDLRRIIERKETLLESPRKAKAFLSASFSDEIDDIISWFIEMMRSMNIEVIWLKEKYQARPTEEKIKENIGLCNCFVQIITRDITEKGKEAGWLGNEIAWAKESSPGRNMAIFVENGAQATGLARVVADNLVFHREKLQKDAPKIIQYLNDLKERVCVPRG